MHNLNDWYLFCRVAEECSITKTSEKLAIPTATISRRVSSLEETTGCLLFNRNASRLTLTDEGLSYYQELQETLGRIENEFDQISEEITGVKGFIKVLIPRLIYKLIFQRGFERLLQQHPHIQIEINMYDDKYQDINTDFDLIISMSKKSSPFFDDQEIAEHHLTLVATKEFLRKQSEITKPDDLHNLPFISKDPTLDRYQLLNRKTNEPINVSFVNKRLNIYDAFSIKKSMLSHLGFTVIPHMLVRDEIEDGVVEQILPEWYLQPLPLYMLTKKAEITPRCQQLLKEVILTEIERFKLEYSERELIT
ncbi:LysR family transcriptional regulator [Vibrio sp. SS-MA-C1-2]|uniref:LysR family transcriptional regulator n=1 Tax=Vibrio sp. SS-MA-C1-2 TaxID=2908646 RepID=UPI001F1CDEAC|nr:LysR family transcriptional regulator [Vibrio sp. SS-MA-C1-2]UJF16989.1 LysR family transcriptional regulator [Vibrio sp. SS-MA-C1-2]